MSKISPELIVFFSSMIPYVEIRASIPIGMKLGLSTLNTLFFATAGMIVPGIIYLLALDPLIKFAKSKSPFLNKYLSAILTKTREKFGKRFKKLGPLFIILLVGVPIPGSGTMTGALIAYVFNMDYWTAISAIAIGSILSALFVFGGVESILALISLFS